MLLTSFEGLGVMHIKQKYIFLLLIVSQCAHSIEEVHYELWAVFAPAHLVGSLLSQDISLGFAIGNILVISIGILCTLYLFLAKGTWSTHIIVLWAAIELMNFGVHIYMTIYLGAYFPGVYTAPLLLIFSVLLIYGIPNNAQQRNLT